MVTSFTPLVNFTFGFIVGAALVGSSIQRTLGVHEGNFRSSTMGSTLNSVSYFFSIYFIAKDNHIAYIGTCIGSGLIVAWMTYRNRRRRDR